MYQILDGIQKPSDVKKLNTKELSILAAEIRDFLLQSVSVTGGHLASNLGVVELTLALFKTLNLPQDGIVWDVGHQTYVHKLLTGRKEQFSTLRQFGGLSGFPKSSESVYDVFNTGHSSTSISAALGMTRAAELKGESSKTVAVIGDGALTGGMAFEALNDAGTYKNNFIVILNDNEMSIAKNVGGLSKYLTKLRTRPSYFQLKEDLERIISKAPVIGDGILHVLKRIKDGFRRFLMKTTVFEDLGFTYLGPIDGHDLPFLCKILERAQKINGPVLIHIKTKKGKGYKFAEDRPTVFHGIGSFSIETGERLGSGESYSTVFGDTLTELAAKNEHLCAITAAMPDGTGLSRFYQLYPKRFFDVGIAEQHAVTFSAGLSKSGLKPVFAVYSSFLQRAYDQILHDVCFQNLDFIFCIDRAGLVGEDGETHQGIYDIAYLTQLPNMTILAPANFTELREMLCYATEIHKGPIAIRYPRGSKQFIYPKQTAFQFGKMDQVCLGKDICILSAGHMLKTSVETAELLKKHNISTSVFNLRTLWPLDADEIKHVIQDYKLIVSIEDGIEVGGLGQHLLSIVYSTGKNLLIKAHKCGSVPHGSLDALYKACGLDAQTITNDILNYLNQEI